MSKQSVVAVILSLAAALAFAYQSVAAFEAGELTNAAFNVAASAYLAFVTVKGVKKLIAIRKSLTAI